MLKALTPRKVRDRTIRPRGSHRWTDPNLKPYILPLSPVIPALPALPAPLAPLVQGGQSVRGGQRDPRGKQPKKPSCAQFASGWKPTRTRRAVRLARLVRLAQLAPPVGLVRWGQRVHVGQQDLPDRQDKRQMKTFCAWFVGGCPNIPTKYAAPLAPLDPRERSDRWDPPVLEVNADRQGKAVEVGTACGSCHWSPLWRLLERYGDDSENCAGD